MDGGVFPAEALLAIVRDVESWPIDGPLLHLRGATIQGDFILRDALSPHGGAVGALEFEDCVFEGDFDLTGSHLQRVCLSRCRAEKVIVDEAQLEGALRLRGLKARTNGEICYVSARAARIDGDVDLTLADLDAGPARPSNERPDDRARFAVDLAHCEIAGSIYCVQARLIGGLSLMNVRLTGDFWCIDSRLEGVEHAGLRFQGAHVHGKVVIHRSPESSLPKPDICFVVEAGIVAHGARFDNEVEIKGVTVEPGRDATGRLLHDGLGIYLTNCVFEMGLSVTSQPKTECVIHGLSASLCRFGGTVDIGPDGRVLLGKGIALEHADIAGNLAVFAAPSEHWGFDSDRKHFLAAKGLSVAGETNIFGVCPGIIDLAGARLRGELRLGHASNQKPLSLTFESRGAPVGLDLTDAVLERGLEICDLNDQVAPELVEKTETVLELARSTPLPFYGDARLVSAILRTPTGGRAAMNFIVLEKDGATQIRIVTGASPVVHALNTEYRLHLANEAEARAYLRFFCACTWSDEGAFHILASADTLNPSRGRYPARAIELAKARLAAKPLSSPEGWVLIEALKHGDKVFVAAFRVRPDGFVEMIEDVAVASLKPGPRVVFRAPLRELPEGVRGDEPFVEPWTLDWTEQTNPKLRALLLAELAKHKGILLDQQARQTLRIRPEVKLTGAHLDSLDDRHGQAWAALHPFKLSLNSLVLNRVVNRPPDNLELGDGGGKKRYNPFRWTETWDRLDRTARHRLRWLNQQYENDPSGPRRTHSGAVPRHEEFSPEPYELFARVMRHQGFYDSGRRIESFGRTLEHKISITRRVDDKARSPLGRWMRTPWPWFLWRFFDYFTSIRRALVTCVLYWALGVAGTMAGLNAGLLLVDAPPVASVVVGGDRPGYAAPLDRSGAGGLPVTCQGVISELIYPLDIMLPLVDLGEERRCGVRPPQGEGWRRGVDIVMTTAFSLLRSFYAVMGWVVISLTIVTATNVFRRNSSGQS